MINPDCAFCPSCLTPSSSLIMRHRIKDEDGRAVFAGTYQGCECGAFTRNQNGVLNLRTDVAEAYGIAKKDNCLEARLKRVRPTIRKAAQNTAPSSNG